MRDKQRTNERTNEQTLKIELLSQWKLQAEFRNCQFWVLSSDEDKVEEDKNIPDVLTY